MKQLHVFFSGRVQGVGFRQTTQRLARGFEVTGWVKNLIDGRVEMLAEGAETEIESFLKLLTGRMRQHIQNTEVKWGVASSQFTEFEINYDL